MFFTYSAHQTKYENAGISHFNTRKPKQCKNIKNAQAVVKIPIRNVKQLTYNEYTTYNKKTRCSEKSSVYRNREQHFRKYCHLDRELSLVYCTDVNGLMDELKPELYKDEEWV